MPASVPIISVVGLCECSGERQECALASGTHPPRYLGLTGYTVRLNRRQSVVSLKLAIRNRFEPKIEGTPVIGSQTTGLRIIEDQEIFLDS